MLNNQKPLLERSYIYKNPSSSKKQDIDMKAFLIKVFETLHPHKKMISNWHLDLMIEYLEAVARGDIKRLIVNLPPRSLKSICINVAWPAWLLGKAPDTRIIAVSYNQRLSEKHSADCRMIMQSEWYHEMFPDTVIQRGMNTKSRFSTTSHGFRFATSTGGTLTGEGADVIIIDDPTSAIEAFSHKKRKRVYNWFRSCLLSRLNDLQNGKIILVMQRLHVDDLTGMLLKDENKNSWTILKIPAIARKSQMISFGNFTYCRAAGEDLYHNAYTIDQSGKRILISKRHEIMNLISSPFKVAQSFLQMSTFIKKNIIKIPKIELESYSVSISKYEFFNENFFINALDLLCYKFLCSTASKIVNASPNYDLIINNYMSEKIVNFSDINGINMNFDFVRMQVGAEVFNIQYQQEASVTLNNLIKPEWLQNYHEYNISEILNFKPITGLCLEFLDDFDYVYQSWDCAIKCGENNDYSVCSSWGIKDKKIYLLDITRGKIDYPKLREAIHNMSFLFKPDAILIEDCAAGQQIIQEFQSTCNTFRVIPIKPKNDKFTRLMLASTLFEQNVICLPKDAKWMNDFIDEMTNFPDAEHDDQVDSVSQFLLWYQKNESQKHTLNVKNLNYKLNFFETSYE
jgi:predicted phage terminase large subunit-like protein